MLWRRALIIFRSGRYKKVVVVSDDKMISITDYQDRSTCPLFGDACGAVLLEPTTEEFGILDTTYGQTA